MHKSALRNFDSAVRDCVEAFLCSSYTDSEWLLASLSTKMGGLGLRNTEVHSSAAFLASQMACHNFCVKLDPKYSWDPANVDSFYYDAMQEYNSIVETSNQLQLGTDSIIRQQVLSQSIDIRILNYLKEEKPNDINFQAHLNLTSASGAGSWLHALPSKALGTHIDPLFYKTMIQRWLRVSVFDAEFHCPYCDDVVDKHGDHCLTCSCGGDRTRRHNLLRNEVFYFCNGAGLNPELERQGLLQPSPISSATRENGPLADQAGNRRPADVFLPRWRRSLPAALDFAVTSGLKANIVAKSGENGSAANEEYERYKRTHLNTEQECKDEGITFIPMICEADGGGWGPTAHTVWNELAKNKSLLTGELSSIIVNRLLQSLGLILHRENARATLRRSPNNANRTCSELLAASAACDITEDT